MVEIYKDYLDKGLSYYYDDLEFCKFYRRVPKSRYHTFKYVVDYVNNNHLSDIVELGTSRSYVDGRFEGCNTDDTKYWEPTNPEKWDWSAGMFTRVIAESLSDCNIITIDSAKSHLDRCKLMTKDFDNITFIHSTSEEYLRGLDSKMDVFYLDTGDMTPIEDTALLQLLEAHLIVDRDLLSDNGLIIIDDVRNPTAKKAGEENDYGKAKYSIPYLLENGFKMVMDEYQVIFKKC